MDLLLPTGQSIINLLLVQGLAETEDPDNSDPQHPYPGKEEEQCEDATMVTANRRTVSPDEGLVMAGPGTEYRPLRLPTKGSYLAVSVTHINQPDLVSQEEIAS